MGHKAGPDLAHGKEIPVKHSHKQLIAGLLLAGLLLAGLGAAAIAQTTVPAPQPRMERPVPVMRDGGPEHRMDGREMRERMRGHRMAQRLGALKQKLAIGPSQEAAWNQWVNAMRATARPERPNRVQFARMTTPERIDTLKRIRAQRQAQVDNRFDATKSFYAALNAQQQRVFDEESLDLLKRGGKRGGMRSRHHGI